MRLESRVRGLESRVGKEGDSVLTLDPRLSTPDSPHGFTLVEALVAVVLVAMGIVGALGAISAGLRARSAANFYHNAALLAQAKLAELESASRLSSGEKSGDFAPDYADYRWNGQIEEGPEGLWLVRVRVSKPASKGQSRQAEVMTYLLRR